MEYKDKINDLLVLSRIAGLIEGLSTMTGAQISKAAAIRLEEASDRLGIMIGDMFNEEVSQDDEEPKTKIGFGESRTEGTPPHQ